MRTESDVTRYLFHEGRAVQPNSAGEEQFAGVSAARKRRGNLAQTLDRTLEPRLSPGRPGRPKGCRAYEWTPEIDRVLEELCSKFGPTRAKGVIGKQMLEMRGRPHERGPRPDSVRKVIERHMSDLGLPTGQQRKPLETINAKLWTPGQITALLACVGGDLSDESVEARTHHTIKAVRAKLARMNYTAHELRNGAFTVDDLAGKLNVTNRQVRRWKENGWLKTTRRRISEKDLAAFLKGHPKLIPYDTLQRETQVFLLSLGFPGKEAIDFQKNVKAVLESLGSRKKRCDAGIERNSTREPSAEPPPGSPSLDRSDSRRYFATSV